MLKHKLNIIIKSDLGYSCEEKVTVQLLIWP